MDGRLYSKLMNFAEFYMQSLCAFWGTLLIQANKKPLVAWANQRSGVAPLIRTKSSSEKIKLLKRF
jgi:hypothetical protein